MKKNILLGLIVLTLTSNAYYDDYKYKNHKKKGYQFGFDLGYQNDKHYQENVMVSGISSKYIHEFGRTSLNAGIAGFALYQSKHSLDTKEYTLNLSARVGSDYFINNINTYFGYGFEGLKSIDKKFIDFGADYYYSSDVIFNLNYRSYNEMSGLRNNSTRISIGVTIPFNNY